MAPGSSERTAVRLSSFARVRRYTCVNAPRRSLGNWRGFPLSGFGWGLRSDHHGSGSSSTPRTCTGRLRRFPRSERRSGLLRAGLSRQACEALLVDEDRPERQLDMVRVYTGAPSNARDSEGYRAHMKQKSVCRRRCRGLCADAPTSAGRWEATREGRRCPSCRGSSEIRLSGADVRGRYRGFH
jgi:hypothetical protein